MIMYTVSCSFLTRFLKEQDEVDSRETKSADSALRATNVTGRKRSRRNGMNEEQA